MNELTLLEDLGYQYPTLVSKQKAKYGIFKCYCGTEFKTQIADVKNGTTKSCGCLKMKNLISRTTTHNMSNTRLYNIYSKMKYRCYNPNNDDFKDYGARGISICKEWLSGFENFYNWAITNGYNKDLSIDRIDVNGNYEPSNCRWATPTTQARNKRNQHTNKTGFKGVVFVSRYKRYVAKISINNKKVYIGSYLTALEAGIAHDKYIIENNLEHTLNFEKENYDYR